MHSWDINACSYILAFVSGNLDSHSGINGVALNINATSCTYLCLSKKEN